MMMNKSIFLKLGLIVATLSLSSLAAFADSHSDTRREQRDRIISDSVVQSTVQGVQTKYGVKCKSVSTDSIEWRCVNGPGCGYKMVVTCPFVSHGMEIGGWDVVVEGFDDGGKNDVESMHFRRLR